MEDFFYESSPLGSPLRQGEILSNLLQVRLDPTTIHSEEPVRIIVAHPFAIVVSQDCDLDWDFRARQGQAKEHRKMPNILFCEVTEATTLRGREGINSRIWKRISRNKEERYHFLQKVLPDQDTLGQGLPELAMDFKRYFTIPADELYIRLQHSEAKRRCRLLSPYLEHFTTRFFYFQYRVALPSEHFSE